MLVVGIDEPLILGVPEKQGKSKRSGKTSDDILPHTGHPISIPPVSNHVKMLLNGIMFREFFDWLTTSLANHFLDGGDGVCLLYTSPSPRD